MKKEMPNYQKIMETHENDFICSYKNSPITETGIYHSHDGYEIYLFLHGDTKILLENDGKIMEPGDLVLFPPYVFHHACPMGTGDYGRVVINIKEEYFENKGDEYKHFTDCFKQEDMTKLNIIHLNQEQVDTFVSYTDILEKTINEKGQEFGSTVLAESILNIILISINRLANTKKTPTYVDVLPKTITDAFNYINLHLADSVSASSVAENLHLHPVYLNRIFKANTGTSIQQYIIEKRLALAKKLLREGTAPIDVCFQSGFNNYSNFSRTFSNHTGTSPKQYQMSVRSPFVVH